MIRSCLYLYPSIAINSAMWWSIGHEGENKQTIIAYSFVSSWFVLYQFIRFFHRWKVKGAQLCLHTRSSSSTEHFNRPNATAAALRTGANRKLSFPHWGFSHKATSLTRISLLPLTVSSALNSYKWAPKWASEWMTSVRQEEEEDFSGAFRAWLRYISVEQGWPPTPKRQSDTHALILKAVIIMTRKTWFGQPWWEREKNSQSF